MGETTSKTFLTVLFAAMLDLMVVDNMSSVALHVLASVALNRMIIAFEFYISSHIEPEIWEFQFTAAKLHLWLNGMSNNVALAPLKRLTQKHGASRRNFVFICSRTRDTSGEDFNLPLDNQCMLAGH
jgi:hypothetical protein